MSIRAALTVVMLLLTLGLTSSDTAIVIVEDTPVGTYPANDPSVWGHLHPTCGSTAPSCGSTTVAAGTSSSSPRVISNCTYNAGVTLQGSNITFQCVNFAGSGTAIGFSGGCTSSVGCRNINFDRVSMASNPGGVATNQVETVKITTVTGPPGSYHSMRFEKSVIRYGRVNFLIGGGQLDKDVAAVEPGYAFVVRDSIIGPTLWNTSPDPSPHSENVATIESSDGLLFENNVFTCDSTHNSSNPCNTAHWLGQPGGGAVIQNLTIRGNRFIGDRGPGNGYEFTFDAHPPDGCVQPMHFNDNLIERFTTIDELNASGCSGFGSRPGSTCTGNTVNGSPWLDGGCS